MRKLMTGVCALGLWGASEAMAQQVAMPIRVAPGEEYTVTVETDQDLGPSMPGARVQVRQVYALEVETPTRWQFTPVRLEISDLAALSGGEAPPIDLAAMNDALSAVTRLGTDIGFECRIDVRGRCTDMTNWSDWSARLENVVLAVDAFARIGTNFSDSIGGAETVGRPPGPKPQTVEEAERQAAVMGAVEHHDDVLGGEGGDPFANFDWNEHRVPILQAVAAVIDGIDSRAAASSMSSFALVALPQGQTLTRGAAASFTESWPMPFRAPPVRMTGTLTLESVNTAARTATVVRTAELDRESLRQSLRAMATYIGGPVMDPVRPLLPEGQNVTPEMISAMTEMVLAFAEFSVTESTRGEVDLRTGLVREAQTTYTVRVSGQAASMLGAAGHAGEEEQHDGGAPAQSKDDDESDTDVAADGAAAQDLTFTVNQVMRVTRGAPAADRLPRAN